MTERRIFKNVKDAVYETVDLTTVPEFEIPDYAGVKGCHRLAICVPITRTGEKFVKTVGITPDIKGIRAHRLEVKRLTPWTGEMPDEVLDILTWKLGPELVDRALRPVTRHTLTMAQDGPGGLKNLKPWNVAYKAVRDAYDWVSLKLTQEPVGTQYGLLMVVWITDWVDDVWEDQRRKQDIPYRHAIVTHVSSIELVKLVEPPDGHYEETQFDLVEDDRDQDDYDSDVCEE